jgi:2',3'-cyclic-nucleotide 3'-phosphodiesterase
VAHVELNTVKFESPNSYPKFVPHVTLASAASAEVLRAAIPSGQQIVPVRFAELRSGEHFFRSVLLACHRDHELKALQEHIQRALGQPTPPPAFPHLSLAYIDDSEAEKRAMVERELLERGLIKPVGDAVAVNCGEDEEALISGFVGEEIWIVKCDGKVEDWEVLEQIPLLK